MVLRRLPWSQQWTSHLPTISVVECVLVGISLIIFYLFLAFYSGYFCCLEQNPTESCILSSWFKVIKVTDTLLYFNLMWNKHGNKYPFVIKTIIQRIKPVCGTMPTTNSRWIVILASSLDIPHYGLLLNPLWFFKFRSNEISYLQPFERAITTICFCNTHSSRKMRVLAILLKSFTVCGIHFPFSFCCCLNLDYLASKCDFASFVRPRWY